MIFFVVVPLVHRFCRVQQKDSSELPKGTFDTAKVALRSSLVALDGRTGLCTLQLDRCTGSRWCCSGSRHSAAHCRFSFRICVNVNVGYVIGCRQVGVDCWRVRKYADEIRRRPKPTDIKTVQRSFYLCHTYCLTFSLIWKVPQHFVTWSPASFSTYSYSVSHQI